MLENCDKIMHLRLNFDAVHEPEHQNLSARA